MKQEIIVFTHHDLDAMGSMINVEFKFPDIDKKYFSTNYFNMDERICEIIDYSKEHNINVLLIADVSFSENKDNLDLLYKHFDRITLIDHHLYPEEFWDDFPNMKIVHDTKKSATLLCHEYFSNAGKNKNLDKLTRIIDVYDIWQTEEPEFQFSQDLNEYFWTYDLELLTQKIAQNEYKLPNDFLEVSNNIKNNIKHDIVDYNKRGLIQRSKDVTICFVNKWFNQIMLSEMENGQNIVIGISSYGYVKIRINKKAPYTDAQKEELRSLITGNPNLGHMDAFSYKYESKPSFDNSLKEIQRIVEIFEKVL